MKGATKLIEPESILYFHPPSRPHEQIIRYFLAQGAEVVPTASLEKVRREVAAGAPDLLVIDVCGVSTQWPQSIRSLVEEFAPLPTMLVHSNTTPQSRSFREAIREWNVVTLPFDILRLNQAQRAANRSREAAPDGSAEEDLPPRVRSPLRMKITLPYLFLATIIILGAAYIVTQFTSNSIEDRYLNQVVVTRRNAAERVVDVETELIEAVRLVSGVEGIEQATRAEDSDLLQEILIPAALDSDVQFLQIIDQSGENLIAALKMNLEDEARLQTILTPEIFSDEAFIMEALIGSHDDQGGEYSGIAHLPWGDFLCVTGPILETNGDTIGGVLAGISLQALLNDIRLGTFVEATIYTLDGEPVATTMLDPAPDIPEDLAQDLLAAEEKSYLRNIVSAGVDFTEILAPLEIRGGTEIGLLGASVHQEYLMQAGRTSRVHIAGFAALGILIIIGVGLYLSSNIAQPLASLAHAANQVASGNLGVHLGVKGGDEIAQVARAFNKMVLSIERSNIELINAYDKTIEGWSKALEMHDQEVQGHTQRVAGLTVLLARAMGVRGEELDHIQRGSLLHDIGKMAIPDEILKKPTSLSPYEREVMQLHTQYAAEMLAPIEFLEPATVIPKYHHERWDGQGYPYGLVGDAIPLAARIFSVVDVYDAMSSDRPYRYGWLDVDVIDHLRRLKGQQFDPTVVDTFVEVVLAGLNGNRRDNSGREREGTAVEG